MEHGHVNMFYWSADYPKSERKWWEVKLIFHHIFHPCLFRMRQVATPQQAGQFWAFQHDMLWPTFFAPVELVFATVTLFSLHYFLLCRWLPFQHLKLPQSAAVSSLLSKMEIAKAAVPGSQRLTNWWGTKGEQHAFEKIIEFRLSSKSSNFNSKWNLNELSYYHIMFRKISKIKESKTHRLISEIWGHAIAVARTTSKIRNQGGAHATEFTNAEALPV